MAGPISPASAAAANTIARREAKGTGGLRPPENTSNVARVGNDEQKNVRGPNNVVIAKPVDDFIPGVPARAPARK